MLRTQWQLWDINLALFPLYLPAPSPPTQHRHAQLPSPALLDPHSSQEVLVRREFLHLDSFGVLVLAVPKVQGTEWFLKESLGAQSAVSSCSLFSPCICLCCQADLGRKSPSSCALPPMAWSSLGLIWLLAISILRNGSYQSSLAARQVKMPVLSLPWTWPKKK